MRYGGKSPADLLNHLRCPLNNDVLTFQQFNENDGKSVWECGNCYQQTPKLTRTSKKKAELDKTWNELVK